MTSAEEHMVHMDWTSVLDHPGLLDPPENTGDAATLWHEPRIGLDSEYGSCTHGVFNRVGESWITRLLNNSCRLRPGADIRRKLVGNLEYSEVHIMQRILPDARRQLTSVYRNIETI